MSSTHSMKQMQRRGIPPLIVQWLEEFGEEVHDHHGGIILHFSKVLSGLAPWAPGQRELAWV